MLNSKKMLLFSWLSSCLSAQASCLGLPSPWVERGKYLGSAVGMGQETGIIGCAFRKDFGVLGDFCRKHLRKSGNVVIFASEMAVSEMTVSEIEKE